MNIKKIFPILIFLTFFHTNITWALPPHKIKQPKPIIIINPEDFSKKHTFQLYLNQKLLTDIPPILYLNNIYYFPIDIAERLGNKINIDTFNKSAYLINPNNIFFLKDGLKDVDFHGISPKMSETALWKNNTLYIPSHFIVFLQSVISIDKLKKDIKLTYSFNKINKVDMISNSKRFKLTFHTSKFPVYSYTQTSDKLTLKILGAELVSDFEFNEIKDNLIKNIKIEETTTGIIQLTINKSYPTPDSIYVLNSPTRLVVDLPKIFKQRTVKEPVKGLYHSHLYDGTFKGRININMLKFNPKNGFAIKPILAEKKKIFFCEKVSFLSKWHNAIAAINGTYFSPQKHIPLGLLIINKEIISYPLYNRAVFFITKDKDFFIDNIQFLPTIQLLQKNISITCNAVNLPRQDNQLVLYTSRYGETTKNTENDDALEFSISSEGIVENSSNGNMSIPVDGYVLSGHGKAKLWLENNLEIGTQISIYSNLGDKWNNIWNNIEHAISGGPTLIKNGKIAITSKEENFKKDITDGKAPRTAIGITSDKEIIFVVVDGRQNISSGFSLKELAEFLLQQDVISALNLDGGGSTTMILKNKILNYPSDGTERKVSNAVLLISDE